MPSIITVLADAKARLKFEIQFDTPPILSDDDITAILEKWERATVWATGTAYLAGDVVIPLAQNGHRFVCVTAGTSGATEPVWSTANFSNVGDGDVLWQEDGAHYDLWDMPQAIYEGWKIKKSKAVIYIGSEDGLSSVFDNCADMVDRSKPTRVA